MADALERSAGFFDSIRDAALLRQWSRSSEAFAYGAPLMTVDELDAKALKPFPDREDVRWFLRQCDSGWAKGEPPEDLIVWKSRQHFCSHAVHASSLWLAAFLPFKSIAYVAQEEQEGKDHLEERIVGMWERTPAWFRAMYKWEYKQAAGVFVINEREGKPWRSYIEAIPRGSRKLRSWTYSRIHFDEAAHNDLLEQAFTGAYATIRGGMRADGKAKKGQMIFTSSAFYHPWLIDLTGAQFEGALDMARADPVRGEAA